MFKIFKEICSKDLLMEGETHEAIMSARRTISHVSYSLLLMRIWFRFFHGYIYHIINKEMNWCNPTSGPQVGPDLPNRWTRPWGPSLRYGNRSGPGPTVQKGLPTRKFPNFYPLCFQDFFIFYYPSILRTFFFFLMITCIKKKQADAVQAGAISTS